ncbi:helix-turn-helix domain-containing protein [Rhodococcus sp. 14C212]|uniref:helix-turn-helix domain-containing protein n=1 Tax=Rhodococcus sp. 14C212 TaxID=2711209 RepID=UPI0013EB6454|nr:helix-turn-helix domain-containing protein [Rhodococcus sp. 14C212]
MTVAEDGGTLAWSRVTELTIATPTPRSPARVVQTKVEALEVAAQILREELSGSSAPTGPSAVSAPARHPASVRDDEWGPAPRPTQTAALEAENLQLQVDQRREQLAASFTRTQVADILGVSKQTVSDMAADGRLVGLKDGREWRFPTWQFTPDRADPVLPDLDRLTRAFPGGEVSLSRWMTRPNDTFAGRTPAQEMARDSDRVVTVTTGLTAAGW